MTEKQYRARAKNIMKAATSCLDLCDLFWMDMEEASGPFRDSIESIDPKEYEDIVDVVKKVGAHLTEAIDTVDSLYELDPKRERHEKIHQ